MAAAIGSSTSQAARAPAWRVASCTARRSTSVMAEGTQTSTRGLPRRPVPTRSSSIRMSRAVVSKSEMAPPRIGRTATMWPGVRPIMA